MQVKVRRSFKMPALLGNLAKIDKMGNIILSEAETEDKVKYGLVYIRSSAIKSIEYLQPV
ncbi:small nuclear ribonucleoprotein G [Nematocida minor]|uniref:small nuclear ribonucleoprotein G n=1 Tax=Nematocida minor TaxID=1912983 RepID=UPI0022200158|nr:small nuclear ribonucleoprotein G [Nematocida minor]KAI5189103.1 small nuclear ribonucleoprotein G [Nematocida minor]